VSAPAAATDITELRWRDFTIPGSSPAVSLARLHAEPAGGFTVVVRFPPGWSRPGTGHYDAVEEVLFLDGGFEMSGARYGVDDYGWFPEDYSRVDSRSPDGALALAWFSAPYTWSTGESPRAAAAAAGTLGRHWPSLDALPSPLPGGGAPVAAGRGPCQLDRGRGPRRRRGRADRRAV
jgi:hypothetical protein